MVEATVHRQFSGGRTEGAPEFFSAPVGGADVQFARQGHGGGHSGGVAMETSHQYSTVGPHGVHASQGSHGSHGHQQQKFIQVGRLHQFLILGLFGVGILL